VIAALLTLEAPIRVVSEANAHEHWRVRSKRAKGQRALIQVLLRAKLRSPPSPPLVVRLTRIAPRDLDSDNLAGAFKHTRDGIADWLGVDDRSPQIDWRYGQERGPAKLYSIRVEIGPWPDAPAPVAPRPRRRTQKLTRATTSTNVNK
jgi:hypothetical protein